MDLNIKGKIQSVVNEAWVDVSLVANQGDQVCVSAPNVGLVVVSLDKVRNKPEKKTAGKVYEFVQQTAFEKQETPEQSAERLIKIFIKEGLVKDIDS